MGPHGEGEELDELNHRLKMVSITVSITASNGDFVELQEDGDQRVGSQRNRSQNTISGGKKCVAVNNCRDFQPTKGATLSRSSENCLHRLCEMVLWRGTKLLELERSMCRGKQGRPWASLTPL